MLQTLSEFKHVQENLFKCTNTITCFYQFYSVASSQSEPFASISQLYHLQQLAVISGLKPLTDNGSAHHFRYQHDHDLKVATDLIIKQVRVK